MQFFSSGSLVLPSLEFFEEEEGSAPNVCAGFKAGQEIFSFWTPSLKLQVGQLELYVYLEFMAELHSREAGI